MKLFYTFLLSIMLISCSLFGKLTSNTTIAANNAFKLGDNLHGSFSVKLKNLSSNDLLIYTKAIDGQKIFVAALKPKNKYSLSVEKNTAIIIENKNNSEAFVELAVKGDTGLSMGYAK